MYHSHLNDIEISGTKRYGRIGFEADLLYRAFSHDITAVMLVFLNNGTAAMLVSPTNPPGIKLCYHVKVSNFRFGGKTRLLIP